MPRFTSTPPWTFFGLRMFGFLGIFTILQLGWQSLHGGAIERLLLHDVTVRPAAFFANLITPNLQARAVDFSIRAPGGGLNILNGCEGFEALFLLIAAFAIAPLTARNRVLGVLIGAAVVYAANQARILVLFYAYRKDHALFALLHGTVAPMLVVFIVAAYFYGWLSWGRRDAQPV